MKTLLQLEELAMFAIATWLFYTLDIAFWWYFVLLFAPDIGMVGYMVNEKAGAATYNLCHHKGLAIALYALGWYVTNDVLMAAGIILFAHASLDRILGYGLKYNKGFKYTHLGEIGNK